MSDDLSEVLVSKPQAGQPAPASEGGESGKGIADETRLAALIDERLENFSRTQQSRLDKFEARVKKQIGVVRAAGVEVTPELERSIRQAAAEEADPVSVNPSPAQPAQAKPKETAAQAIGWREAIRDDLYRKYGVELETGDPELATVKATDSEELTDTLRNALKAKKARIEQAATLGAQGRLPVVPAGGQAVGIETEYQQRLSKIRRGDVMAITQLQAEYRQKGMNI